MRETHDYQTDSLDLAAFLVARGRYPSTLHDTSRNVAIFSFRRDNELLAFIEEYLSGIATVSAKMILAARRRLYHEVRRLREENHEM